jgi:hypothetical protein
MRQMHHDILIPNNVLEILEYIQPSVHNLPIPTPVGLRPIPIPVINVTGTRTHAGGSGT